MVGAAYFEERNGQPKHLEPLWQRRVKNHITIAQFLMERAANRVTIGFATYSPKDVF
jgi:hypothetical protein